MSYSPRREGKNGYWLDYFKQKLCGDFTAINNIDLFDEKHLLCSQNPCNRANVIYAIIININTFYIGRSIDLQQRLKKHYKEWLSQLSCNYKIHYCVINQELNLDIVERFFIQKYKSNLNGLSAKNKLQICNKLKHKR